jgi:hypothetical protein
MTNGGEEEFGWYLEGFVLYENSVSLHASCINTSAGNPTMNIGTLPQVSMYQNAQSKAFADIRELLHSMRAKSNKSSLCSKDEEDDKVDASWKRIPPLLQDIIIRASETSDSLFPTKPTDSLLQIL